MAIYLLFAANHSLFRAVLGVWHSVRSCTVSASGREEALDKLRSDMRADFARDGVVAYAVAFPAAEVVGFAQTVIHRPTEHRRKQVIALEAHDGTTSLRSHREIKRNGELAQMIPVETGEMQFGGLLTEVDGGEIRMSCEHNGC
jgi:hypothetical protein